MAQVIVGGTETFNALLYGKPHPGTQKFLSGQLESFSNTLTDVGHRFFEGARDIYERVSGSTAARIARAASRQVRSMWQSDEIRELVDIASIQNAPLTMQRWIMAEPTVRKLYHRQQCDGYSDTYVDLHPDDLGPDHYDWRRVMNGYVIMNEDEDAEYEWEATTYMEELLEEDEDLSHEEQVDIITTWDNVVSYIRAKGSDPTSRYDSSL